MIACILIIIYLFLRDELFSFYIIHYFIFQITNNQ